MKLKKSKVKKILVISLSNLGDVILTFPVIDILKRDFPSASVSVVVGPKAKGLLAGNPRIARVHIFDKRASAVNQLKWIWGIRKERFDLVVDLRNTAIPFLLGAPYRTALDIAKHGRMHMKEKHLARLRSVHVFSGESQTKYALHVGAEDKQYVNNALAGHIGDGKNIIVVSPGAANHTKRWNEKGFVRLCDRLVEIYQAKIIFVGDQNDQPVVNIIAEAMKHPSLDVSGRTTMPQLADIIGLATLVIANDSAVMHLASYLDVPVLALFGPTDEKKYGPWSSTAFVARKDMACAPCEKSGCAYHHECMDAIMPDEVVTAIDITSEGVRFIHP